MNSPAAAVENGGKPAAGPAAATARAGDLAESKPCWPPKLPAGSAPCPVVQPCQLGQSTNTTAANINGAKPRPRNDL